MIYCQKEKKNQSRTRVVIGNLKKCKFTFFLVFFVVNYDRLIYRSSLSIIYCIRIKFCEENGMETRL